ncbi:hypothetical protein B5807_06193 [Epicoccum nigrum]|uniref:Uncharacterized protein n=1 Tax=Epicoccum nigrum TaxID=105696 RepID=A0A1Y2M133_EPING|nr:hypothetical protein B5807_06193 [Epicoccum nigrum]
MEAKRGGAGCSFFKVSRALAYSSTALQDSPGGKNPLDRFKKDKETFIDEMNRREGHQEAVAQREAEVRNT